MFGWERKKQMNPDSHRYYLLPGQGRGARKKHFRQLFAALAVAAVFAGLLGLGIWWINQHQ